MDYYLKYIKYKNKYLELKGGTIPNIKDTKLKNQYLPLIYSTHTITFNNKVIKDGDGEIYNLTPTFKYEKNNNVKPNIINTSDYEKNYNIFFEDEIVINEENKIPFDLLLLDNNFNINNKLYNLILKKLSPQIQKNFQITFKKYSNININTILNKYIFINKFREFLEILYSTSNTDDEITYQIMNLYNNKNSFINICEMSLIYQKYTYINKDIQNKDISKITNFKYEDRYDKYIFIEIYLIKHLRNFINFLDYFNNIDGLKDFLGIKISLIFFANFIGKHYNNKKNNRLYPINADNLICNLLNLSDDELQDKYKRDYKNEYLNFPTTENLDKILLEADIKNDVKDIIETHEKVQNLLNYKYKNIIYLLSEKYSIHLNMSIDILNKYVGTGNNLPFYLKDIMFKLNIHKTFINEIKQYCIDDNVDKINLYLSYLKLIDLNNVGYSIEITDNLLLMIGKKNYSMFPKELLIKNTNGNIENRNKKYLILSFFDYICCDFVNIDLLDMNINNNLYYYNVCIIIHDLLEHYNNYEQILNGSRNYIYDYKKNKITDEYINIDILYLLNKN
jgi:hypothetical protein